MATGINSWMFSEPFIVTRSCIMACLTHVIGYLHREVVSRMIAGCRYLRESSPELPRRCQSFPSDTLNEIQHNQRFTQVNGNSASLSVAEGAVADTWRLSNRRTKLAKRLSPTRRKKSLFTFCLKLIEKEISRHLDRELEARNFVEKLKPSGSLKTLCNYFHDCFFASFSSQRGRWESADADFNWGRWHPTESHRRIYLIILLRGHLLAHKVRACPVVVCKPARALHGPTRSLGFRKVVLR